MTETTLPLRRAIPLRPLFTATILLGSFLLFLIQPMFGRSVLPLLGGSPSVWNTAMLFYQVVLLLGYLYAHSIRRLPLGRQLALHLALFAVAALTLPIAVARWLPPQGDSIPALWLLGLLAVSIGPVFFVVSAQAPLMQSWFARSADPAADNPYFLYAASNIGSFAALVAYPLLIEPSLRLGNQSWLWSAGFVLLGVMVALCGLSISRYATIGPDPSAAAAAPGTPVTWAQRGRWTLLAFVPSALLLSTTTHLTTDIMAMPLLWVIPLGVYLLSFVIAFGNRGARATHVAERVVPYLLLILGSWSFFQAGPRFAILLAAGSIVLLFMIALALHGRLSVERPAASALTDFYLWISVGGALGGVFCALVAPVVFDWAYEHPLLLVLAAALVPGTAIGPFATELWSRRGARLAVALLAAGAAAVATWANADMWSALTKTGPSPAFAPLLVLLIALAILAKGERLLFAWCFAMLMLALGGWWQLKTSTTEGARSRSFFGIYSVEDVPGGRFTKLMHGTTLHGLESTDPRLQRLPMTYYAPDSGVGQVMAAAPRLFGPAARIAFVGLGSGTLACYARPGQTWTAYEIDPVVVKIARERFHYISTCQPRLPVVIGDARLTLANAPPAGFDLLAVDAFSSDAIPLHLVTREAFEIYGRTLAPDGVLMIHITNRYLDLEPVIAEIARAGGWTARVRNYKPEAQPADRMFAQSVWVVLTRSPQRMAEVAPDWESLATRPGMPPWSDDFASILPVLRLKAS